MATTFQELKESLIEQMDEVALVELLNLTSEDLVNTFSHQLETMWLNGRLDSWLGEEDESDNDLREPD